MRTIADRVVGQLKVCLSLLLFLLSLWRSSEALAFFMRWGGRIYQRHSRRSVRGSSVVLGYLWTGSLEILLPRKSGPSAVSNHAV